MLPTPDTSHVPIERVYEPAEDSFLLMDTIASASETAFLSSHFPPAAPTPLILELGSGSGVVLAFLTAHASLFFNHGQILTSSTDINPHACLATSVTVKKASSKHRDTTGLFIGAANADLFAPWRSNQVDMLIFNPPYVPTEEMPASEPPKFDGDKDRHVQLEEDDYFLALAYAGGRDGMETTDKVIAALPDVLSGRGIAYILLCHQNRPDVVKQTIRDLGSNWRVETVGTSGKTGGWEKLQILRCWRE